MRGGRKHRDRSRGMVGGTCRGGTAFKDWNKIVMEVLNLALLDNRIRHRSEILTGSFIN